MATGSTHGPRLDAQHRPITAGGTVATGPVIFEDATVKSGLAAWHNVTGTPTKHVIIEAKGSGVCLIDYDGDGWLDIYFVSGSTLDALAGKVPSPHAALFHNNHDGTFTNVAAKAGVENNRWGLGCAVGDFDNDGRPDLYVTNLGKNRLYHNNGDGTFTDVAARAGVALDDAEGTSVVDHTGSTWGDYDGDGRLDLFVAGYIRYDFAHPPGVGELNKLLCQYRGQNIMCGPRGLKGVGDHLFHNNGDGTFTDMSEKAGVRDPSGYYGLGVLFADVNGDGKVDLLVANDSTPNYLYINKGDGTFEDASYMSGYALNGEGREVSNMGIAVGDYENNGHLSVVSTVFSDDYNVLFRGDGAGGFEDVGNESGIGEPSEPFVSFGDGFLDFDNDGWLDLLVANGHVYPQADAHPEWGMSYAQRPLLFRNLRNGKFKVVPAVEGTGLARTVVARGAAFGDLFNDGRIDAVINNVDGPPLLLRNVVADGDHWVELKLVGGAGAPRDAVGATVYLTAGGQRQRRDVLSGGSYLSSNEMRLHFGLGAATVMDGVEIHWPNGKSERVKLHAVDREYVLMEGEGVTAELCQARPCAVSAQGARR
jgi:enediyne biosynthesis protein E4